AGTGGSSGLRYLKQAANQLLESPMYPELWDVRSEMFSRPQEFDLATAGDDSKQGPSHPSPLRTGGEGRTRGAGGGAAHVGDCHSVVKEGIFRVMNPSVQSLTWWWPV